MNNLVLHNPSPGACSILYICVFNAWQWIKIKIVILYVQYMFLYTKLHNLFY